ncbi:Glutathione S-transferase [Oceanicola granulosus HTCC2516]|uniref:Glutathione S-transferase n=1 Tax=Oceanicola granulosus (strain ATCC BAA-861 / DSM 15982 / KCTC 12143 / HTCC2516) TaxID=314256 RepID=Q2CK88_OCEGH|nr:glutathione S-transferase [Oceanicola granulosus]EAR52901.1 Glutathione S-transferase [Oceanicola granulosus HTCC2516]
MQLVMSAASPFVRTVRVLAREAGLAERIEEVPVATTPLASAPEALAANPLGKIPALVRPDGPTLYDSRVICRYLDAQARDGFYPKRRLWEVLTLEATAHGVMEAAVLMIYEARLKGEEGKSADWIAAQWQKVARALDALEGRWMSHLSGPLDVAQIATAVALDYLDFRHGGRDWREGRPALAAWHARFAARPAMVETKPA